MTRSLILCFVVLAVIIPVQFAVSSPNCDSMQMSPDEIIAHIRYLASDELEGRMSGSQGAEKAAGYISSEYINAGLMPLGDNNSYFQKFSFTQGIALGPGNRLRISIEGNNAGLILGEDFNTLSFSSTGEAAGELVFAGYGISAPELGYDDYGGIDVKDKVVMVMRYTPEKYEPKSPFYSYAALRYKAMNAREKGAKAIIFVTPHYAEEEEDLKTVGLDYSYSDSGIQALILRRNKAKEVLSASGKDLKNLEESLSRKTNSSFIVEDTNAHIKTDIIVEKGEAANIIGMIEGSDSVLKAEYIIVGAHYDHIGLGSRHSRSDNKYRGEIHNGADDNASGAAGLIELARYYSCNRDSLKRSLVFIAFSAEELGLIGASEYVDNPKLPLDKTVAMLNMDMIGRLDKNKLTILGVGSSPGWNEIIGNANTDFEFNLILENSGFAPSDQSVFFAKGIPVLHFFTGVHEDYHTPEDDWEKINSKGERKILLLMTEIISELATTQVKPTFTNEKEPKKGFAKFNIYLGTIPDYSSQMRGVRLMGVKDGSPADKAGLKGKDTIVQYNGVEIKNIYDYVYALGASKPGKPTSLVVLRDHIPLSLIVVPELRESEN